MSVLLILILISVGVAVVFLLAFYWSAKSGQFDDTYSPSIRMLGDDDKPAEKNDSEKP